MGLPGRNDFCHCGSGKKYKKCCLQKDEEKAQQERIVQQAQSSKEEFVPAFEPEPMDSLSEPIVTEPEDQNITRLWDDLKEMNYPEDSSRSLLIIETFIKDFPHLAGESGVIDELFSIEEYLYKQRRLGEYVTFLENIQKFAPDYYATEAEWYDLSLLRCALANKQIGKVEHLTRIFKEDPVKHVENFSDVIDLLAWSGADEQTHDLVWSTYKEINQSSEVWNCDFIIDWVYFDIYDAAAESSMSIDDCMEKIVQDTTNAFAETDSDISYNRQFIAQKVKWIREDIFKWDCPHGDEETLIDFFLCMGWQVFKYIMKTTKCSKYQARFIQRQLYDFWIHYRAEKRPKICTYFVTTDRINKFIKRLTGVSVVAFLQAVYHFADYLFIHDKIDEKTRSTLREHSKKLYTDKLLSTYDSYPASELIIEFPFMNSVKD